MQSEVNFQKQTGHLLQPGLLQEILRCCGSYDKKVSVQQVDFVGKQNSLAFLLIFTGLSCIFIVSMPEKEERYEIYSK